MDDEGVPRTLNEVARGETVGEMAVLTGETRSATVVAIRDSVLAHATHEAFDELWRRHPQLPLHMAKLVISRLKRSSDRPRVSRPGTLCVLAVTAGVDVRAFAERLASALDRRGVTTLETSERVDERFGAGASQAADHDSELHHAVGLWTDDLEFWNEYVLLVADGGDSEWTRRCLRSADEVLLVARADEPPALHPLEETLLKGAGAITGARKRLVLLHDDGTRIPTGTAAWLDRRDVDAHLHVRLSLPRDAARLARVVGGHAVGLALAGGGARGFAHLGVYRALEEAGVVVDLLAGTSIGAAMAALVSVDRPAAELIETARSVFARNPTGDVNVLPLLSLVKGGRLRRTIDRAVTEILASEADMADTWRTFCCVATNYTRARELVISRGRLARAVRASVSIPVALPPVPWNGDLLIDGGVLNNFPTDVLAAMGARRIVGVDLAREKSRSYDHEEVPSSWGLLRDRLRGRSRKRYRLPGLGAVLMNTTILYSESRRERSKRSVDLYFNPDLGRIGLLDWKQFDRIVELGYQHAKEVLARMPAEELAPLRDL